MMGSAMCWPLRDNGHAVRPVRTHLDREISAGCRDNGWHSSLKRRLLEGVQPFQIEGLPQAMEGVELVVQGVSSPGVERFAHAVAPTSIKGPRSWRSLRIWPWVAMGYRESCPMCLRGSAPTVCAGGSRWPPSAGRALLDSWLAGGRHVFSSPDATAV